MASTRPSRAKPASTSTRRDQPTTSAENTAPATNSPSTDSHSQQNIKTAALLQAAREKALKSRNYNSSEMRNKIIESFRTAFDGKDPFGWQVDVTEALLLGLDCTVIAGTGAGKTMPFVMPLLVDDTKEKTILIISPLNELEEDQARRFKKLGLTATAVNGEVYNNKLHQELVAKKHRVILTSPEMCLEHPRFSQLMRSPDFMKNIAAVVIDEAHCISQWGDKFRKIFAELGKLRSFVALHIPFLATSATLPPLVLADVQLKLHFEASSTYFLNLGNNRDNITPMVHRMKGAAGAYPLLDFLVREATAGTPLMRTIIFVNTRILAQKISRHLQESALPEIKDQINYLHAGRTQRARRRVMREFREGKINILCATEAAGMGMDISDVDLIVQFMVPSSLSVWMQRAGRAGRSGKLALAVLLVEPSVFKKKKPKKKRTEEQSLLAVIDSIITGSEPAAQEGPGQYQKKVEEGMREWAGTVDCRRVIADKYFNNPPRSTEQGSKFPCCDNCIQRDKTAGEPLSEDAKRVLALLESIVRSEDEREPTDDEDDNDNDSSVSLPAAQASRKAVRRGEHLAECRQSLSQWRKTCWKAHYAHCVFGSAALLPDKILTTLASRAHLSTVADIKKELPHWAFVDEHGAEVLQRLQPIDAHFTALKQEEKQVKAAKRARQSAENKLARDEERRVKRRVGQHRTPSVLPSVDVKMEIQGVAGPSRFAAPPVPLHFPSQQYHAPPLPLHLLPPPPSFSTQHHEVKVESYQVPPLYFAPPHAPPHMPAHTPPYAPSHPYHPPVPQYYMHLTPSISPYTFHPPPMHHTMYHSPYAPQYYPLPAAPMAPPNPYVFHAQHPDEESQARPGPSHLNGST